MSEVFTTYLNSLLDGNRNECKKIIDQLREDDISIMDLYENVLRKSLYEVGELWEYNKISVATEHMATSITEAIMNELFAEIIGHNRLNKTAVIACVEKEDHQVGGKMVADIFEKNGWDTYYLGANTPTHEIIQFCKQTKPDVICLSLSVYLNVFFLLKEIKAIREVLDIPIFIGGQALRNKGFDIAKKFKDVHYFSDLYDIENYLKGRV